MIPFTQYVGHILLRAVSFSKQGGKDLKNDSNGLTSSQPEGTHQRFDYKDEECDRQLG